MLVYHVVLEWVFFLGLFRALVQLGKRPVGPHEDPRKRVAPLELAAGRSWLKAGWWGLAGLVK